MIDKNKALQAFFEGIDIKVNGQFLESTYVI